MVFSGNPHTFPPMESHEKQTNNKTLADYHDPETVRDVKTLAASASLSSNGSVDSSEVRVCDEKGNVDGAGGGGGGGGGLGLGLGLVVSGDETAGANDNNRLMEFCIGDFVWGKIKSHPWWPGRIFDSSDASEYALAYKHERRVLVGHFGDHSFTWCNLDQLKPFVENFEELSRKSSLRAFVNAVEAALDEFGRLMELEMTCPCVSNRNNVSVRSKQLVINQGVQQGTYMHEGGLGKFSAARLQPTEILANLKHIACSVPVVANLLHLTVLKRLLPAFFRSTGPGCYPLQDYNDEGTARGPIEAADIERKNNEEEEEEEEDTDKEEKQHSGKDTTSSTRKIRKISGVDTLSIQNQARKARRQHERSLVAAENNTSNLVANGTIEFRSSTPRERKKSKYLCPPYISLQLTQEGGSSGRGSEVAALDFSDVARIGGWPVVKSATQPFQTTLHVEVAAEGDKSIPSNLQTAHVHSRSNIHESRNSLIPSLSKVLSEIQSAALDPVSPRENQSFVAIKGFLSLYRSSIYRNGSDEKASQARRKRDGSEITDCKTQPRSAKKKMEEKLGSKDESNVACDNTQPSEQKQKVISSAQQADSTAHNNEASGLTYVKQKLQEIEWVWAETGGRMSPEMKSNLVIEMKELLGKLKD
ncbi:hypothetical protein Dimus_018684 [Dionaea muscipula]